MRIAYTYLSIDNKKNNRKKCAEHSLHEHKKKKKNLDTDGVGQIINVSSSLNQHYMLLQEALLIFHFILGCVWLLDGHWE